MSVPEPPAEPWDVVGPARLAIGRLRAVRGRARRRGDEVAVVLVSVENADALIAGRGWQTYAAAVEALVARAVTGQTAVSPLGTSDRVLGFAVVASPRTVHRAVDRLAGRLDGLSDTPTGPIWAQLRISAHRCRPGERAADSVGTAYAVLTDDRDRRQRGPVQWSASRQVHDDTAEIVNDLAVALMADTRQIGIAYQPVVDLASGRHLGAEALVRWHHPERGDVSALTTVQLAENHGLINRLGHLVLEHALDAVATHELEPGFRLHVNVSPLELADPGYVAGVLGALARRGLPPSVLLLEVTETALMGEDEDELLPVLTRLCEAGVGIGIDDFGTGYSSIARLHDLPADTVKVDRSLVRGVATSPEEFELLGSVMGMLRLTGVLVIAEGVESVVQVAHLRTLGFRLGQGYALGRPSPWSDAIAVDQASS